MKSFLTRRRTTACIAAVVLALPLSAAVKTQERTKVDFTGMLGGMVRFFGGKAAKEGVLSSTALQGNRLMRVTDQTGELIDLDQEKIYEIDFSKKRYKVTTFDEYRKRMQEAQQKAAEAASKEPEQPKGDPGKEMDIDFDVKNTGQTRNISGYDCKEVVITITMREKGKTLEQGGGMVVNADMWMGPEIPEMKEVAEFHKRYMEKIGVLSFGDNAAQMAMAQKMYPMMQQAMEKFQKESADMSGTAILTVMKMETVATAEQRAQVTQNQQQAKKEEEQPKSIGGFLGGALARKIAKKQESQPQEAPSSDGRATLMTTTTETLSVTTNVTDSDVTIPADFKEKN